ncbi:hypothetical protein [Fundidesulfovibrio terrae]|uniref:hypothetical protein n=1 Tax=Fundidesulfovibrio terrae TaxID=2922866 RepID=UPI001FAF7F1C|nr:hypothetical protein [Fundidesulfovibrio terrae]
MKKYILISTSLLWSMVLFHNICFSQERSPAVMSIAKDIQRAIIAEDAGRLMSHVRKRVVFVDEYYSKEILGELIKDRESWLQRNLFVGDDSLKKYFETARDVKIILNNVGSEVVISYQSSNYPAHAWPWCSIVVENERWYFSDMFAYR